MLRWFGRRDNGGREAFDQRVDTEEEDEDALSLSLSLPRALDATADPSAAFGRSPAEERRRMERELVLRFDSRELRRGEAWCLVETPWLDAWMAYVLAEDDPESPVSRPGPLTNVSLFDPTEYCLRKGLEATTHYRGVNPQVYALYAELYGTAGAKPIVRWTLDIYATPVMIDDVHEMLHAPELKARVEVAALHDKFDEYARPAAANEDEESLAYRWCCRCEYLVPCLNRLLGGGPTYARDEDASFLSRCCQKTKKKKKARSKKKKKGERSRRRRSYDFDEEDEDTDESQEELETKGLLG